MIADDIFLRSRRDLPALDAWLRERRYWTCRYWPDHPGFRYIDLLNGDLFVGQVVCIMPSLFEEALHAVRVNAQGVAA